MSAKPYCKKTAAVIGWLIQNFPASVDDGWVGNAEATKELLSPLSKPPLKKQENSILKLISGGETILIDACDGTETLAQAADTFESGIDSDFKNWDANKKGGATAEIAAQVYEMAQNAMFAPMFSSLGSDLDKLCFTQHQIIVFCKKHVNWLRTDGYGTFFLFKVDGQFFVADVNVRVDGLGVLVPRLGHDRVWNAERLRRVVVPQMAI